MTNVAAQLRRQKAEILRQWVDRVRATVPAAADRTRAVLLDHIPLLLDQLARSLETLPGPAAPPASQQHADQRAALAGYSLDQVVQEYHQLRRVVIELMDADSPLAREQR